MADIYRWKRFWCPRGNALDLSDGGFLVDPKTEYGKVLNGNVVAFEQLADKPSLVLLGEPGIGKSWALRTEKTELDESVSQSGGRSLWLDLRSYGDEGRLYKTLFESAEFKHWREGDYILHLFLDSLDECLLRIDNIGSLLADQFLMEPTNRLRIRIACRNAPWPEVLETALRAAYSDGFEVYELAPLRRRDVQDALHQKGIEHADDFFARVQRLDVASFAIKPVTLGFLIDSYLRDPDLPANQMDLYERGCRILCEEANESRKSAGRRGGLDGPIS